MIFLFCKEGASSLRAFIRSTDGAHGTVINQSKMAACCCKDLTAVSADQKYCKITQLIFPASS